LRFILLYLILLASCSTGPKRRTDRLSILQGVTNPREVEFSVVAPKEMVLNFELRSESGEILTPEEIKTVTRDFSSHIIHKIIFNRDAAKDYNLYAFQNGKIIDQRLIGRGQREQSKLRIAVASCLNDYFPKHFGIWDQVTKTNPDYLLLIGDNVYANKSSASTAQDTSPEILWKRYLDTRLTLPVYFQEKLIPTHAIWDDNDFGASDGDSSFQYKDDSKSVFQAFWAQDLSEDSWTKGSGVGGLLSLGDFNLYFLDARTYRSPKKQGTHLGLEQTAWFLSKLRDEKSPSFIIKGDQYFGGYHSFDSFEKNHSEDFQNFVTELRKIQTPFIFLSGDRHMSEIMQFPRSLFGRPSFEITSSPLHARVYEQQVANPWRVVSSTGKVNFILIDNEARDDHWFLDVLAVGEEGEILFRRELAVFIKDLQDNLKEMRKRRSGKKRRYRFVNPARRRGR
jgi:alkaline phosphatase D